MCHATKVSQQALSERFLTFPAAIFLSGCLKSCCHGPTTELAEQKQATLPDSIKFAKRHFERIWVADGSTLEALFQAKKA